MPNFDLATAAEEDLKKIALYTISKWGGQQAVRYGALLDAHFEAIGNGKAKTRIIMPRRPDLRVSRIAHQASLCISPGARKATSTHFGGVP
jgi:plasmid stabilization system protein ParE